MKRPLFLFLVLASTASVFAQEADFPNRLKSTYFEVSYQEGIGPLETARKLHLSSSSHFLLKDDSLSTSENPDEILAQAIDALFLEVSDILGMKLSQYQGKIKICHDLDALQANYLHRYNRELGTLSFYDYEGNTIYLSASHLRPGILGHEMAHAILSHFFVILPPVKVQEILAGYVEYQLNKN